MGVFWELPPIRCLVYKRLKPKVFSSSRVRRRKASRKDRVTPAFLAAMFAALAPLFDWAQLHLRDWYVFLFSRRLRHVRWICVFYAVFMGYWLRKALKVEGVSVEFSF